MSEWLTYRPQDFLLFSERVYWRLFELHNAAVWPWQIVAFVLGAAIVALVLRPRPRSGRLISAIVAVAWLVVAWAFLWNRYQSINWAASYVTPFFVLEAVLIAWIGGIRNSLSFSARKDARGVLGLTLFVYALALHPFAAVAGGRAIQAAEMFAVAPDPTAIGTLGLIAAAKGGRTTWWLLPVPLAWSLLSWATLQAMGAWEAWIPLSAVAWVLVALLLKPEPGPKTR